MYSHDQLDFQRVSGFLHARHSLSEVTEARIDSSVAKIEIFKPS